LGTLSRRQQITGVNYRYVFQQLEPFRRPE
jgi:hypothetical protein